MLGFIDELTATEAERRLGLTWADFAIRRYGNEAADKLRESLDGRGRVKSMKALRLAIRRVEARSRTTSAIATR